MTSRLFRGGDTGEPGLTAFWGNRGGGYINHLPQLKVFVSGSALVTVTVKRVC